MPKNKVKVEIITVPKNLFVVRGYLRGSADRVDVDMCVKCGSIVFDPMLHDEWHRSADPVQAVTGSLEPSGIDSSSVDHTDGSAK